MENYYDQLGVLVLSSRLRKLSERLLLEIGGVYKAHNIDFEPGWFHILNLLSKQDEMSITEIADTLQVTHPSVIQVVKVMEKRKLIDTFPCKDDGRKRMIRLSSQGDKLIQHVKPMWEKLTKVLEKTLNQGEHSRNLLLAISELELNIEKSSFTEKLKTLE